MTWARHKIAIKATIFLPFHTASHLTLNCTCGTQKKCHRKTQPRFVMTRKKKEEDYFTNKTKAKKNNNCILENNRRDITKRALDMSTEQPKATRLTSNNGKHGANDSSALCVFIESCLFVYQAENYSTLFLVAMQGVRQNMNTLQSRCCSG